MDLYFHLLNSESIGGFGPTIPLEVEVSEKPMASIFRITFGVLAVVTVLGPYIIFKRRPVISDNDSLQLL
ncbi:MAG: hypothetical protein ACXAD7_29130 [Candidatus Kariarchaeaceae archaeon]|jgi:hypothetical protein